MDINDLPGNVDSPEALAAFVGKSKAIMGELKGNDEATKRAVSDLGDKLRVLTERAETANWKGEQRATGDHAEVVERYVTGKGVQLRAASRREQFAGREVEVERRGLFDDAPQTEWQADLQRLALGRMLYRNIFRAAETPRIDAQILAHCAKAPRAGGFRDALEKSISDTANTGAEWIPDVPISTLYEDFYTPAGIAALFEVVNIPGPIVVPKVSDTIRPYLKGKVSTDNPASYTASSPGSSSETIEPVGFAARVLVDDAAAEDAIFPLIPEIQRRVARAILDGYEDAMMNGDTAGTHQDAIASWNIRSRWGATGLGGSADHRRGFLGFRPIAADRAHTVDLTASQTAAGVMASVVGAMGERAASDIVLICSPEVLFKKLMTDSNVLTVDKFGTRATIVTGQLAAIGGHPLVVSRWMGADLAASGLYTGSGALSGLVAVDRSGWKHYQKRASMVEIDKDINVGAYNLVCTMRRVLKTLSASSQAVSYFSYNWLS